jgi:hypothetical protein
MVGISIQCFRNHKVSYALVPLVRLSVGLLVTNMKAIKSLTQRVAVSGWIRKIIRSYTYIVYILRFAPLW